MENDITKSKARAIETNEGAIRGELNELVRSTVEETLNNLLDAEAQPLCEAERYERSSSRKDQRAGYYKRGLETQAGKVELKVPKLRSGTFETAIIERYKRREASVEAALGNVFRGCFSAPRGRYYGSLMGHARECGNGQQTE